MSKHKTLIVVVVALAVSLALAACAGFNLGDIIKVKTPVAIQQADGVSASLTLNEAEAEYRLWMDKTKAAGLEWKNRIASGNEIRNILGQLAMNGLNDVGPTIGGIPVLGPSIPLLTAGLGLFLGRSGLTKHKEESFNAGLKKGAAAAKGATP